MLVQLRNQIILNKICTLIPCQVRCSIKVTFIKTDRVVQISGAAKNSIFTVGTQTNLSIFKLNNKNKYLAKRLQHSQMKVQRLARLLRKIRQRKLTRLATIQNFYFLCEKFLSSNIAEKVKTLALQRSLRQLQKQ